MLVLASLLMHGMAIIHHCLRMVKLGLENHGLLLAMDQTKVRPQQK